MGYFIDSFDVRGKTAVMRIAREEHDSSDQWGWCLSWLFDIAGELALRGANVPPELEYRAGAFGPEVSEERAEYMGEFSTEGLTYAAKVLNRFAKCLDRAGESY